MAIDDASVTDELRDLMRDFDGHHQDVEAVFRLRYAEVEGVIGNEPPVVGDRALLISPRPRGSRASPWRSSSGGP